jgi:hypothetical protein
VLLASLLLGSSSCDTTAGGGTTITPGGRGGDSRLQPEGGHEGESIGELDLRLDRLSTEQAELINASNEDPGKCEELCELAQAICEVKTKMCTIAEERVTDDEYQNLCRKAKQRCRDANDSCLRCVERHEGTQASTSDADAGCGGEPVPAVHE